MAELELFIKNVWNDIFNSVYDYNTNQLDRGLFKNYKNSKSDFLAMKKLKKKENIITCQDKGRKFMVINENNYYERMLI